MKPTGEDCFVQPNDFIPERWTTNPELIKDRSAFVAWGLGVSPLHPLSKPFTNSSLGPYSCIGKNLGLMEIRTATVLLLDKFDIKLAAGEDGTRLFAESKDCFAWVPGPLKLVFEARTPEVQVVENGN